MEKINGYSRREKFRIRYYNDNFDFIRLEKKSKVNGLCSKFSAKISKEECIKIINNDIDWMLNCDRPLIQEFYYKIKSQMLKPKTVVDYVREAYIYKAGNVRITFDKNVRSGICSLDLFNVNLPTMKIPNKESTNDSTNQPQLPNDIGGGIGGNSNGANLVWNGDDISNYSAIFDNAIFKTTDSDDYTKILDMIEHLDSLDDIESYLDVDEVLKYFAANTFLVNLDSYVSNMNHNYYLYENDGIVSILPWDYNLSFAGFQAGSASNAINFPIDSPVSDSLEESPLIGKLLEVDEYKDIYHHYLNEIVENFVNNGTLETLITKTDSLISSYIQNDATAFYTYDEYKASLSNLINFGYDRATSIAAQLDGSQPSTNTGTIETTVDLSAMGQQGGGNEKGEMNNMRGSSDTTPPNADSSTPQSDNTTESSMNIPNSNTTSNFPGNISSNTSDLDPSIMMQAMQIIQSSEDGSITDSIKTELLNLGLTNEEITQLSSIQIPNQDNNGMHDIKNNNLAMGPGNISTDNTNLIITLSSIVLLVIALVFVSFFKKRKYIS